MKAWLGFAVALFLPTICLEEPAAAQVSDGNSYLATCGQQNQVVSASLMLCTGYLMALADTPIQSYYPDGFDPQRTDRLSYAVYCRPNGVTYSQQDDIFVGFLRRKPEVRHLPSPILFQMAMNEAFPCSHSPTYQVNPDGSVRIIPAR